MAAGVPTVLGDGGAVGDEVGASTGAGVSAGPEVKTSVEEPGASFCWLKILLVSHKARGLNQIQQRAALRLDVNYII